MGYTRSGVGLALCLGALMFFSGCAASRQVAASSGHPRETPDEQLDAARKVVGGMANKDVSPQELRRFGQGLDKDPEARTAVQKIMGTGKAPVTKYSPVTGKHYSGELEYEPGTGVKLLPVE